MTRVILISLVTTIGLFIVLISFSTQSNTKKTTEHEYVCTPCNSECDTLNYNEGGICTHCNMPLVLKKDIIKSKKIAFYLQDGVEILDFAGPMEVFAYAGYDVFTVSRNKTPITTQGILKIIPDYSIEDAPSADILAFFGGNSSVASKDPEVINWVKSQKNIEYHFSVCTGAFILAESGLLKNKTATTFHNALDDLEKNYPEINVLKNVRFVDNGTIITTAGISAGIDGALHLVAKLNGFNAARKTAYYMEYDKWIPGEGVLLSEDNPYKDYNDTETLEAYVGRYEYLDGLQVEIKINENEKSLFAIVDALKYPLFYIKKDTILSLNGDKIIFLRTKDGSVKGYNTLNNKKDVFFLKLN